MNQASAMPPTAYSRRAFSLTEGEERAHNESHHNRDHDQGDYFSFPDGRAFMTMTLPAANFTERARKVCRLAQESAADSKQGVITPAHLLIGLLREGDGVAAAVLRSLGVSFAALEAELTVKGRLKVPTTQDGAPIWAADTVRALEQARDEARGMDHPYLGTEDVLLGLLVDADGAVAQLLARHGVRAEDARAMVVKILNGDPA